MLSSQECEPLPLSQDVHVRDNDHDDDDDDDDDEDDDDDGNEEDGGDDDDGVDNDDGDWTSSQTPKLTAVCRHCIRYVMQNMCPHIAPRSTFQAIVRTLCDSPARPCSSGIRSGDTHSGKWFRSAVL